MEDQYSTPHCQLTVARDTLILFTTVLQSGIELKSSTGIAMGRFLNELPGFTADYVGDVVQTIFLNGTAIDDLTTPLDGDNPTLALSAAMPGLAGAIFRKNSFHSALRTDTKKTNSVGKQNRELTITLKLFNSIARERGIELLTKGVCMKAKPVFIFFKNRGALLQKISTIEFEQKIIDTTTFLNRLSQSEKINIRIVESYG